MNANLPSAAALLTAAQRGQPERLEGLLEGYRNYLKLLARTEISRRQQSRVDPSDVVQETLVDACRGFPEFRGHSTSEFTAWLRQILARNLSDAVRRHQASKRDVRREQSLNEGLDRSSEALVAAVRDPASSPSEHLSQQEQAVRVANAIERLPADYRDAILWRQFEQLSFDEVARRLDRTAGAARMLFARAIARLRHELREDLP